jgi:tRNA G18 (ribose-2'-O)-methylase SpoU
MGAVFRVPLGPFEDATGRRIALVAHGGEPLHDLDLRGAVTFVLGAEREGLPDSVAAACDARGSIGLEPGAESLNVALAAALALYERRRSRGTG